MKKGANSNVVGNDIFFFGEYAHALDPQRRIAIPKAWRVKGTSTHYFLLPGRHQALQLIPYASFRELLTKARKTSFADASASLALARLGAMAQECHCDSQGRIPIPPALLRYAGLKHQAVLIGAVTTIQIWTPGNWRKYKMADAAVLDEIQKIGERPDGLAELLRGKT